ERKERWGKDGENEWVPGSHEIDKGTGLYDAGALVFLAPGGIAARGDGGGKSGPVARSVAVVPEDRASLSPRSDGRSSKRSTDRIGCGWPVAGSAPPPRQRGGSQLVGFDTRAVTDSERSVG